MKFSIVTVVLNNLAGLRVTAQSLRAQAPELFEWIVVDGGSTDGTLEALHEFKGLVDDFQSAEDGGIYDGMNKGLSRAGGDFVLFLNGGDTLLPDVLQRVFDRLSQEDNMPNLIFGGTNLRLPNGQLRARPVLEPQTHIWHRMPSSHQATFIARTAHQAVPYDVRYPISADYHMIATIFKSDPGAVLCLDFTVAETPIGGPSFSARHPVQMLIDHHHIQTEVLGVPLVPKWLSLMRKACVLAVIRLSQFVSWGGRNGG